mmetsp:Transcript_36530/g.56085  ORF Transcript_36530/g.56085 Transcript_36530/m.56085 type:complete len:255 (+) Transcript_36530:140-904(+)|eukprot:CAMPEP_0170485124 /NCGR_PEP_ID=MMETSP0208-20121228/4452_1 /TAXON_ID=197538 /ORGANISM="Strombidium inclinatum, Strain S3" /LENGTH=254 /DNA_ID=CAMNT_0010758673 /DNA_START=2375 /DNA_END=3139 /DNA_ORIENTATION=-
MASVQKAIYDAYAQLSSRLSGLIERYVDGLWEKRKAQSQKGKPILPEKEASPEEGSEDSSTWSTPSADGSDLDIMEYIDEQIGLLQNKAVPSQKVAEPLSGKEDSIGELLQEGVDLNLGKAYPDKVRVVCRILKGWDETENDDAAHFNLKASSDLDSSDSDDEAPEQRPVKLRQRFDDYLQSDDEDSGDEPDDVLYEESSRPAFDDVVSSGSSTGSTLRERDGNEQVKKDKFALRVKNKLTLVFVAYSKAGGDP